MKTFEVKIKDTGDEGITEYVKQDSVLAALQFLCSVVYKSIIFDITEIKEISEETSKQTMIDFQGEKLSVFDVFDKNPNLEYINYSNYW